MDLTQKKCVPCEVGMPPLSEKQAKEFMEELPSDWHLIDAKKIKKEFSFKNFKESMVFVNEVAKLAEEEGHHPDIYIFYDKVNIELSTHAIDGLSENDFVLAAKIEVSPKK